MSNRIPPLGASRAAAILGLSPWSDGLTTWLEMTGRQSPAPGNAATLRGQILEPGLRDWYAEETGSVVHAGPKYGEPGWRVTEHVAARWDGWRFDDGALVDVEIKSVNGYAARKWEEGVPVEYLIQALVQLAARHPDGLYATRCDLVGYVLDSESPVIHPIPRAGNERRIEALTERCERWYVDHILGDTPPAPQSEEERHALLEALPVSGVYLPAADGDRELVARLATARRAARAAEAEQEAVKALLLDRVGMDAGIDGLIRGSHVRGRVTIDGAGLKKAHPDIYAAFARTGSPSRRWYILDKTINPSETDE